MTSASVAISARPGSAVEAVVGRSNVQFVPLYCTLFSPIMTSQLAGSLPQSVLIAKAPPNQTSSVQAPVFAVVAVKLIVI